MAVHANFISLPRPLPLGEVDLRSKDGEGEDAWRGVWFFAAKLKKREREHLPSPLWASGIIQVWVRGLDNLTIKNDGAYIVASHFSSFVALSSFQLKLQRLFPRVRTSGNTQDLVVPGIQLR